MDKEFRPVNQILGTQPSLGPLPADQIFPWMVIVLAAYFIVNGIFGGLFKDDFQKWLWTVLIGADTLSSRLHHNSSLLSPVSLSKYKNFR